MSYPMIILEMNNSTNTLEGMGFVLNETHGAIYQYRVYQNINYNRHTYKSRFYVDLNKTNCDYKIHLTRY